MESFTDILPGASPVCIDDDDELQVLTEAPKAEVPARHPSPGLGTDNEEHEMPRSQHTDRNSKASRGTKKFSIASNKRFSTVNGLNLKRGSRAWIGAVKALPQNGIQSVQRKTQVLTGSCLGKLKLMGDCIEENEEEEEDGDNPLQLERVRTLEQDGEANFMESLQVECDKLVRKFSDKHFGEVHKLLMRIHSLEVEMATLQAEKSGHNGHKSESRHNSHRSETRQHSHKSIEAFPAPAQDGPKRVQIAMQRKSGFSEENSLTAPDFQIAGTRTSASLQSFRGSECPPNFTDSECPPKDDEVIDEEGSEELEFFELWPYWMQREAGASTSMKQVRSKKHAVAPSMWDADYHRNLVLKMNFDDSDTPGRKSRKTRPKRSLIARILNNFMILPSNLLRLSLWDPVSCLLVAIECIYIPMQFFPLREGTFSVVFGWISRLFWTLDIPLSFLTGFENSDGTIEIQPDIVGPRYMKSWFLLDLCLIILDWVELFLGSLKSAARLGNIMKALRLLRIMRIARIIRTVQVPESLSSFVLLIKSDSWKITTSVLRIVLFFICLNHLLACIWYGIADSHDGNSSWLTANDMVDATLMHTYLASYHFSLAQFAGSIQIDPVSTDERLFAVAIGLAAFFLAAVIVSSITSNMTQWNIVNSSQSTRLDLLMDFLIDHNITRTLSVKIVRSARAALDEQSRNTPEQRIELLSMIPEPMKLELHHELYMPSLECHPFMSRFSLLCPKTMHAVCHRTLARVSILEGDILFAFGEVAPSPRMYFVLSGQVVFVQGHRSTTPVTYPAYLCEPALWTPWFHQGTLVAKKDTAFLSLSVEKFQEVVLGAPDEDYNMCIKYGRAFLQELNKVDDDDLSDLRSDANFRAEKWLDDNFPCDSVLQPEKKVLWGVNTTKMLNHLFPSSSVDMGKDRLCCCCPRRERSA